MYAAVQVTTIGAGSSYVMYQDSWEKLTNQSPDALKMNNWGDLALNPIDPPATEDGEQK